MDQCGVSGNLVKVIKTGKIVDHWVKYLPGTPDKDGYLKVTLNVNGVFKKKFIHRLVLEAFIGPCPTGMECRHKDNNPKNNALYNIEWATPLRNSLDRVISGSSKGENHAHILTEKQVLEIRNDPFCNREEKAKECGVSPSTISGVLNKQTWKHI